MSELNALVINCTLKASPEQSNTQVLAGKLIEALEQQGVGCEMLCAADYRVPPGTGSDLGGDDQWPELR